MELLRDSLTKKLQINFIYPTEQSETMSPIFFQNLMQAIEQRQLISRKNLVGCDDIIFFEHYVLKLMGLNGTILTLGGWDSSFFFFLGSTTKELKLIIKRKIS